MHWSRKRIVVLIVAAIVMFTPDAFPGTRHFHLRHGTHAPHIHR